MNRAMVTRMPSARRMVNLLCSSVLAVAGVPSISHAAPITWTPAGGGDFNTPGNWNPAQVPGVADAAIFNNNATGNVTFSGNANPLDVNLSNNSGAITMNLGGNTLTMGSTTTGGRMLLGTAAGQTNNLTITNGTVAHLHTSATNLFVVGNLSGSNGNKLTLSGPLSVTSPSTATPIAALGVAGSNNNTLRVENGASVVLRGTTNIGVIGATPSSGNLLEVNDGTFSLTGGSRGVNLRNGSMVITKGYSDLGFLDVDDAGNSTTLTFNSGEIYSRRTQIDNTKNFVIGDGGLIPATYGFAYSGGTLTLGAAGRPADLVINSNGILAGGGIGTITGGGTVRGFAGAKVMPSIIGQPVLATDDRATGTIAMTGAWDNSNIEMILDVGDFPTAAAAPTPFTPLDIVNITGAFTHGGLVTFNLAGYVEPSLAGEFKVVGWTSEVGSRSLTGVQFIGGAPLPVRFDNDGLYITVPEPLGLSILAAMPMVLRRRRA